MHEEFIDTLDLTSVAKDLCQRKKCIKSILLVMNKLIFYSSFQQNSTCLGHLWKHCFLAYALCVGGGT